ncbi:hypothetical protein ALTERO38_60537 [Alteromonas sp. 38]|nr:hypothetical protein ALTER154_40258 [Alteromonas sp. 154]VXC25091.1 hypothetical protein ALTERO38_60537 [Alteromonas sp. 38]
MTLACIAIVILYSLANRIKGIIYVLLYITGNYRSSIVLVFFENR